MSILCSKCENFGNRLVLVSQSVSQSSHQSSSSTVVGVSRARDHITTTTNLSMYLSLCCGKYIKHTCLGLVIRDLYNTHDIIMSSVHCSVVSRSHGGRTHLTVSKKLAREYYESESM